MDVVLGVVECACARVGFTAWLLRSDVMVTCRRQGCVSRLREIVVMMPRYFVLHETSGWVCVAALMVEER